MDKLWQHAKYISEGGKSTVREKEREFWLGLVRELTDELANLEGIIGEYITNYEFAIKDNARLPREYTDKCMECDHASRELEESRTEIFRLNDELKKAQEDLELVRYVYTRMLDDISGS